MEGVRQIARAAREWGQETTVVSLDRPGQPYLEGNAFRSVAMGPALLKYGYTPKLAPWLRAHAREFDAVVVNGIWQYSSFAVWRALRGSKVPYFVFAHGMLDPYFKRSFPVKHLKKLLYWPWAEFRVLRDARAVLFTCEEERLLARQSFGMYRVHEEVVGYGTAAPTVDAQVATRAFFSKFPTLLGQRILLFLSRVHPKKGCDLLIEAFGSVAHSDPRWQLVVAGPCDDELSKRLKVLGDQQGVGSRITWAGMLTGEVKWGAFYATEAFVLPSHQENFGIAVAEALACGTPVLISNKINIWREIQDDRAGLVEPDTLEGTRALLERWSALNEFERARVSRNARACFDKRFEISRVAKGITQAIERLRR